ncbi:MAG: putative RuBisCo-expression protein CbbX [Cytophagales bacterium]|jgi:hypothetical protein|nr:caspase family protein [Bacteroidota bacterium]WHZ06330.1 MAG: putative RuBisCo-expression protein CbbX [Cytophagales bacterium]
MKILIFLCFTFFYFHVCAQDIVLSGNSESIRLNIGNQKSAIATTLEIQPGQKIQGTSEKTRIAIGLKAIKTTGSNSQPVSIKVGASESPEERSTNTNTTPTENSNAISGVPNYYTLFIGVDNYQFSSANLSNLSKPIKDASAFRDVLLTKYAFLSTNSTLLKNPTRTEIIKVLEELAKKITPRDNLLIFYAGHGYWDERLKVGYWLPSDSRTDDKSSWIANSTIRDYIAGIQSKHTLLISDACFSGSIFKTREVTSEINEYGVSKVYQLPSRKAMTSGTLTTVPDESKFMQYLVKKLSENTSKYLTTRQLFLSVETAVLNNTSTVPQLGVIQETGDEGGDFIFIKRD